MKPIPFYGFLLVIVMVILLVVWRIWHSMPIEIEQLRPPAASPEIIRPSDLPK